MKREDRVDGGKRDRLIFTAVTFLTPIPALIAAGIAVPALLVLYFLKLRRRPVRVSSTLLWDQAVRDLQVNVPFRLVRPTWLLLLQLLILGLFLGALARPAIDLPEGVPSRIVILIDRSASMSARDVESAEGPRARLDVARERALAWLETMARSGSTFAVIGFGAEPLLVSSFSGDVGAARAAIRGLTPTDQPGDVKAAIRLASGLFSGDTDESGPRQRGLAMLFSDGSYTDAEGLALSGAEFRFQSVGPARRPSVEGSIAPEYHDNLGIVAMTARREWEDPTVVRVFARVINASGAAVTAPVVLTLDGREVDATVLTVPGASTESESAADDAVASAGSPPPPTSTNGSATATFALDTREGGVATVRIDRPDVLSADNSASVVIAAASKPQVFVVVPDRGADAKGPDWSWIITDVVEAMRLPMRIIPASQYEQQAASLRPAMLIFDRVTPKTAPAVPSLSFGAGMPGLVLGGETARGSAILSWKRSHPVLRNVTLDGVSVARPRTIEVAPEQELARGLDGTMIAASPEGSIRRLVVGFELSQSNWPKFAGFPIFVASAIDYLTMRGDERAGMALTTGEAARLEHGSRSPLWLDGPIRIEVPRSDPGAAVSLGILERAGVYRVVGMPDGEPVQVRTIAANLLDETESAVAVRGVLRVSGQVVSGTGGEGGPREIWAWLVLAALVLLGIEWAVNAWMMRV